MTKTATKKPTPTDDERAEFLRGFLACALWAGLDWRLCRNDIPEDQREDNPAPLDDAFSKDDIRQEARDDAASDCNSFLDANYATLEKLGDVGRDGTTYETHGHDFFLTRNGHGTGFWDRGYPKKLADALTAASKAAGSWELDADTDGEDATLGFHH